MTTHWAIDLGTSNTTVCEDRSGRPHVVNLPALAREEPITQTPVIPSVVCVMDDGAATVLIGQEAVTYNWDGQAPGFVAGFKRLLGTQSHRTLAQVGRRAITAHDAGALFLRELLTALERESGEQVRDVTIATPAGFYETYRAELSEIVKRLHRDPWWKRLWARIRRAATPGRQHRPDDLTPGSSRCYKAPASFGVCRSGALQASFPP